MYRMKMQLMQCLGRNEYWCSRHFNIKQYLQKFSLFSKTWLMLHIYVGIQKLFNVTVIDKTYKNQLWRIISFARSWLFQISMSVFLEVCTDRGERMRSFQKYLMKTPKFLLSYQTIRKITISCPILKLNEQTTRDMALFISRHSRVR